MRTIAGILGGLMLTLGLPLGALAQTSTTSVQAQLELIANLTKQIQALQSQLNALTSQRQAGLIDLITTLKQGDQGENVKTLQALLASDADVYPEGLLTGYFGSLTAKAVRKFQTKHGLSPVGNVGPRTVEKLKQILAEHPLAEEDSAEGKRACAIVPPGHLIAPGWLRKHGGVRPIVPECQKLPPGIANRYRATTTPTTTPPVVTDTTRPIISGLNLTNVATTSVQISWITNESATGKVYYHTSNPLNLSLATTAASTTLSLNHSFRIDGLTASTTYFYIVESVDAANNIATSTPQSFMRTH